MITPRCLTAGSRQGPGSHGRGVHQRSEPGLRGTTITRVFPSARAPSSTRSKLPPPTLLLKRTVRTHEVDAAPSALENGTPLSSSPSTHPPSPHSLHSPIHPNPFSPYLYANVYTLITHADTYPHPLTRRRAYSTNPSSASAPPQAQCSVSSRAEMVDWSAGTSHSTSASTSVSADGLRRWCGRCDLGDS